MSIAVLLFAALGLLAGAAALTGRWVLRRRDGLGRPIGFPFPTVIVLAVLGAALLVPVVRHHDLEQRLSAVASELVGVPVRVHCQTAGQEFVDAGAELGFVRYGPDGVPEPEALIKRKQCGDLRGYLRGDQSAPSPDQVLAVHVLSHEARHMAGTTAEALAECQAIQRDALTAQLLGATREQGLALARRYWASDYPHLPEDYLSPDCVPGGGLDEHLDAAPWAAPA